MSGSKAMHCRNYEKDGVMPVTVQGKADSILKLDRAERSQPAAAINGEPVSEEEVGPAA
jgi:hypothetical protein